jgi:hypothetical protein
MSLSPEIDEVVGTMTDIVDVAVDPDLDGFKYEFPVNVYEVSGIMITYIVIVFTY